MEQAEAASPMARLRWWWHLGLEYPKTVLFLSFAAAGAARFLTELSYDLHYSRRVARHRKERPPPNPATKRPPVSGVTSIWESVPQEKKARGIGRLRHVRSLDNLERRTFRPGSKLEEEGSDSEMSAANSRHRISRPFRILSVDGGGVKGMFSLRILERLMAKFPRLIDEIDLIAGTSTGGLIGLMLANGYSPTQGLEIYRHNIPIIFHTNVFRRLAPFLSTYTDKYRQEVFDYYFGGKRYK